MTNEIKWDQVSPPDAPGRISIDPITGNVGIGTPYQRDDTEVMRITKDGIWVNPDMSVDDAAKAVLDALDAQIKTMVQRAVEDEREACAKVCDDLGDEHTWHISAAIRTRGKQ